MSEKVLSFMFESESIRSSVPTQQTLLSDWNCGTENTVDCQVILQDLCIHTSSCHGKKNGVWSTGIILHSTSPPFTQLCVVFPIADMAVWLY